MKKIFLLLITSFALWSCDNKDDKTTKPIDQLPPETQTGANTFGFLLNGKPIIVKNTSQQTAIYQQNQLQLGGGIDNDINDVSVIITVGGPLNTNVIYDLSYPNNIAIFVNNKENCYYDYPNTLDGNLILTHIDQEKFIVSGRFEFSTVTDGCEDIKITNGRFDLKYIP
jgi:hypothetical protein